MQWSEIDIPAALRVPAGLGGVAAGLILLVAGYRLWKYTIFLLGFVLLGTAVAFTVFATGSADCALCQAGSLVDADADCTGLEPLGVCTELYLKTAGAGIAAGAVGGLLFLACYFMVLCCMGCYTGMAGWIIGAMMVLGMTATQKFADFAELMASHGSTVSYVVFFGALLAGIICAYLFVKFEKEAIMLGTSWMGAQMVGVGVLQGIVGLGLDSQLDTAALSVVTWFLAGGGFCVQWCWTSKWVTFDGCKPVPVADDDEIKIEAGVVIIPQISVAGNAAEREPLLIDSYQYQVGGDGLAWARKLGN